MRYQLDVIADSVADLVLHAGGWMYDRVFAGWEVRAVLPLGADDRAVRILGADTTVLDLGTESTVFGPADRGFHGLRRGPHAIAASGRLCTDNPWVAALVDAAVRSGDTQVTLWGDARPPLDTFPAAHRLSVAARAFKAQALAAAGQNPLDVDRFEVFHAAANNSATHACSTLVADLVPAG